MNLTCIFPISPFFLFDSGTSFLDQRIEFSNGHSHNTCEGCPHHSCPHARTSHVTSVRPSHGPPQKSLLVIQDSKHEKSYKEKPTFYHYATSQTPPQANPELVVRYSIIIIIFTIIMFNHLSDPKKIEILKYVKQFLKMKVVRSY